MSKPQHADARTRKLLDDGQSLAYWSRHCIIKSADLIRRSEALLAQTQPGSPKGKAASGRRRLFKEAFLANPG